MIDASLPEPTREAFRVEAEAEWTEASRRFSCAHVDPETLAIIRAAFIAAYIRERLGPRASAARC
jgi:hypothetical protein